MGRDAIEPPSLALLAAEGRGFLDIPALLAVAAPLLATAPRGQRHPVMVLPGLGADDRSTLAIRSFLEFLGYEVHGWGRGRNIGAPDADLAAVAARVIELEQRGGSKVSLVGWSRGGIIAREVARQIPASVRMVITLGSPFAAPGASNVRAIWRLLTGRKYEPPTAERISRLAQPIPVPATSIYTRADGVVAWRACLEQQGEGRENVEVSTTHIGLGFHAPALWVIADRLAQPPGTWKAFRPPPQVAIWFPATTRRD
ncbi:alpha/beta fold hydrolase [Bradyrhizobium sp. Pear76]|uniref:esterase/lipase family protein n=1 Tax=Bradyrhizobium oropedii TaxID=1571201 RepID=UPI001E4B9441|nr:alpha/beta fold hydrolase [Bradyrhizobium oropedii]MCC8961397.1 alpha/beta fold hydrolase [Bradyrhizobium oropedii]